MIRSILIITIFIILASLIFTAGWIARGLSHGKNGDQEFTEVRDREGIKQTVDDKDAKPGSEETAADDKKQSEQGAGEEKPNIRYSVEVGSFVLWEKAVGMTDRLKEKGYNAQILKMRDYKGMPWYLVQIGDFDDRKAATMVADDYEKREGVIPVVNPVYTNLLTESKESGAKPTPD